jgi:hypothetical protein
MNIESKLNSNEYKCKLSEHLTSLLLKTKSSPTEATTSSAFESEIYFFIRSFFGIDINFRKEESQTTLKHKFIGRMDAVCNSLVIEYKKLGRLDKEKDKEKATEQLTDYLLQLLKEDGNEYHGVLTDGIKVRYLYFQNGVIHKTPFKNIDETDLDKIVQSLVDLNNKRFVPKNIVDDFKLNSRSGITSELANYLFKALLNKKS